MKTFIKDKLKVEIFETRALMGEKSARDIADTFAKLLKEKSTINVIWAAAPSQNDVLKALVENKSIEWDRINAYHMDEYIGLSQDAPQGFGNFLKRSIFGLVNFKSVNYINPTVNDAQKEAERYSKLLAENKPDVVVLGIGENGHIAFNDPPVADFNDNKLVKVVELDQTCRNQQVNDGCFDKLQNVPTHAITLTIPALCRAKRLFCVVPAATKAWAVNQTINGEISERCPASIMRCHNNATLYVDNHSSKLLNY